MLSTKRLTPILLVVFLLLATIFFLNTPSTREGVPAIVDPHSSLPDSLVDNLPIESPATPPTPPSTAPVDEAPEKSGQVTFVSYDKTTPPTVGCEAIVHDLQHQIIEKYQVLLQGVRYANIWGYLGAFPRSFCFPAC